VKCGEVALVSDGASFVDATGLSQAPHFAWVDRGDHAVALYAEQAFAAYEQVVAG
jgi:hypothetical protein